MSEETATNPAEGEDNAEATLTNDQEVDTEGQNAEPELDADGNAIEPEEESEEIEHDGKKYTVPKALKPLMLMQADYTRKTQEVAEQARAVMAERQALHQTSQAEIDAYARASNLQAQLAQYQQVDWRAWHEADPLAAAAATSDYTMLRDAAQQALGQLSNLRGQRDFAAKQETARRIEQGRGVLTREVPGWGDDLKARLITFASGYGFSRDDLDDLEADPRVAKVLHAAFVGSDATRKANKAQGHLAAQAAQPAAKVGTGKAPAAGLDDRTDIRTWMDRRNAQTRKKRA